MAIDVRPYIKRLAPDAATESHFYEAGYAVRDENLASVRLPAALVAEAVLARAELVLGLTQDGEIFASVGEHSLRAKLFIDELVIQAVRDEEFVATRDLVCRLRRAIDLMEAATAK